MVLPKYLNDSTFFSWVPSMVIQGCWEVAGAVWKRPLSCWGWSLSQIYLQLQRIYRQRPVDGVHCGPLVHSHWRTVLQVVTSSTFWSLLSDAWGQIVTRRDGSGCRYHSPDLWWHGVALWWSRDWITLGRAHSLASFEISNFSEGSPSDNTSPVMSLWSSLMSVVNFARQPNFLRMAHSVL